MITDKDKFILLINKYANGNMTRFAEATGIDLGTCSKIRKGIFPIGLSRAMKILEAYPTISYDWLVGNATSEDPTPSREEFEEMKRQLATKQDEIAILLKQISILQTILSEKMNQ